MLRLYIVRHGATHANAAGRYQGWSNTPLSPEGERQATAVAAHLPRAPTAVHASDLTRASRTAALAYPRVRAVTDPRLRELRFGAFEGATVAENEARFGNRFRAWRGDPRRVRPPGGEALAELEARLVAWLAELPAAGNVVAFTHGGCVRTIVGLLLAEPHERMRRLPVANTDVVRVDLPHGGAWRVGPTGGQPLELP